MKEIPAYGHELRLIRQTLGLTQAEMSRVLGTTAHSVMRYENGMRKVPEPTIRLARQLVRMQTTPNQEGRL